MDKPAQDLQPPPPRYSKDLLQLKRYLEVNVDSYTGIKVEHLETLSVPEYYKLLNFIGSEVRPLLK
jgi:hypothetical protein